MVVAPALIILGSAGFLVGVLRRGRDLEWFAQRRGVAWPWLAYVWLTIGGLAVLAVALLGDGPGWLGWGLLAADAGFAVVVLGTGDIPPFVFYPALLVVAFERL